METITEQIPGFYDESWRTLIRDAMADRPRFSHPRDFPAEIARSLLAWRDRHVEFFRLEALGAPLAGNVSTHEFWIVRAVRALERGESAESVEGYIWQT